MQRHNYSARSSGVMARRKVMRAIKRYKHSKSVLGDRGLLRGVRVL